MVMTRRRLLALTGGAALGGALGCRPGGERRARGEAEPAAPPALPAPDAPLDDGVLDELLAQIHAQEPRSVDGLSTHAPMVVEALCVLGLADRARAWLARSRGPARELPGPGQRIDPARWREALGPRRGASSWEAELVRWGDWRELFVEELAAARWQAVLDRWVARLAPGLGSAATHGVIRTAHAARALGRHDTPPRRAELARGLAYWAAAYEALPATAGTPVAGFPDALAQVPRHTAHHGGAPDGNIVAGLRAAGRVEGFAAVRDLIALPDELDAGLSALTSTFARVYLQHGTRGHAIAFVHAVTGPCALRRIAPHVAPATARAAFPYAWQTAAAIYAAYAAEAPAPAIDAPTLAPAELAARALANGDDHAIKFTEVLVAEHAVRPDPAYLAAAADAVARL